MSSILIYNNMIKKYNLFITENINVGILPSKKINTVYHVGDMDIKNKSNFSLEGSGLSISINPNEWKQIARLGGKDTYELYNKKGVFIDGYKLNKKQKTSLYHMV